MTHFSDNVRSGEAYFPPLMGNKDNPAGREEKGIVSIDTTKIVTPVLFGAVAAVDADGVVVNGSATGAGNLSATGALVSDGVATFDVERSVRITSTANESGVTFTLTGNDRYGKAVVWSGAGTNNTAVDSAKTFKTVSQVAVDGALTSTQVDVGTGDDLGLPYRLATKGQVLGWTKDGITATDITITVADQTAVTATTGDVRGKIQATAVDGSATFSLLMVADATSKTTAVGLDQYSG
jgi:hypothetical protein